MKKIRKKIIVSGIVQGVGFRPFIYKLAKKHNLTGFVFNSLIGVEIEAQGTKTNLDKFIENIKKNHPPQSKVDAVLVENIKLKTCKNFQIKFSNSKTQNSTIIPHDLATCKDCEKEIFAKNNRRYSYPFTNCTNCGPRFTIVNGLPYDRQKTSMKSFKMCKLCQKEYDDPFDRRFHAQPNACNVCGPKIWLEIGNKKYKGNEALLKSAKLIKQGKIIALKSLGGFQFACDSQNFSSVKKLRTRKKRPDKPFALMVSDIKMAEKFCYINKKEKEILTSSQSPIVMLKKRKDIEGIAPNLNTFGIMLAYTPIHKILFASGIKNPLIMTSANKSEEPICISNEIAKKDLKNIADGFLMHDRPIVNRCDDSVVFELNGNMHTIRYARGLAPQKINLPFKLKQPTLATGANKTGSFVLGRDNFAILSQYIGDLDIVENQKFYKESLANMQNFLKIKPKNFASDTHPEYFTSQLFKKTTRTQHHLSHILSVMAENSLKDPVIGLSFDGTGLGEDNSIWGGEFLIINKNNWQRAGYLKPIKMPGGDKAVSEIWRLTLSWIYEIFGDKWIRFRHLFKDITKQELTICINMVKKNINSPKTSSIGRLFDAVSYLADADKKISYQAQAAMELEAKYNKKPKKSYKFDILNTNKKFILDASPVFKEIIKNRDKGQEVSEKFHLGLALASVEIANKISLKTGIKIVCLSGGVFQNKVLLELMIKELEKKGFEVYTNKIIPSNDAGVGLGQIFNNRRKLKL
ncbi:MAG: carbamoyltransferase HypF [Elusimicrobiaceae bacterium]|nr:carbamoyltransferase HypF [Elusimicrobiaceae bacterium]